MTEKEAIKLLAIALEVMPNMQKFDLERTATVWAMIMPDITYDIGQKALLQVLRHKTVATLPLPAEIISMAKDLAAKEKKAHTPNVYEAWDEVCRKLGSTSRAGITWSSPIVKKAVQCIGAYNIATATYDIFPRFAKVYENILKRRNSNYESKVAEIIQKQGLIKRLEAPQDLRAIANQQMLEGKSAGMIREVH